MMESEADTLSIMMNNDWSNFNDVLRKCFHHEPLSIARKVEDIFVEISEPKLSVIISGTPGQLKPLLKSKENGLFSRFLISLWIAHRHTYNQERYSKRSFLDRTLLRVFPKLPVVLLH